MPDAVNIPDAAVEAGAKGGYDKGELRLPWERAAWERRQGWRRDARAVLSAASRPITCPRPEHTNSRDLRIPWTCPSCGGSGVLYVLIQRAED